MIMEYIPESSPKMIRSTSGKIASDKIKVSTGQWPKEANHKSEALGAQFAESKCTQSTTSPTSLNLFISRKQHGKFRNNWSWFLSCTHLNYL